MGRSKNEVEWYTLSNGIRVVYKRDRHTNIAHAGLMFDLGSRDEPEHLPGLAHFWEHMAFKGTQRRSSIQILSKLDRLGGELNAYTTKEKICFHASMLNKHFEKSIDLLSDIAFHSVFPEKELEKERQVIIEEMSMYADAPDDAIQDDFDGLVFGQHRLGNNILGTYDSIKKIQSTDLKAFVQQMADNRKLVCSIVGNLPSEKVFRLAEQYLSESPFQGNLPKRFAPEIPIKHIEKIKKPIAQSHCVLGGRAYPIGHPDRLLFFMLLNYLGGPAMNTRLNINIRERYGWVYSIDAQYAPYTDCGQFSIYFGTDKELLSKCKELVLKELKWLMHNPLGKGTLSMVKNQLKGQLAMSEENNMGFMLMMAKSVLDLNRIETMEEIFRKIDLVQANDLQRVAQEIFAEPELFELIFEGTQSTH